MPKVIKAYGGKVAVEFRHNPLGFHKQAKGAAIASMAAGLQGKFWEMHDLLFENRKSLGPERFVAFANQLGMDVDRFKWDMADPRVAEFVENDIAAARALGVRGVPMFIINGRELKGKQPVENFKAIIDEELKKAEEALANGTPRSELAEALAKANGASEKYLQFIVRDQPTRAGPSKKKSRQPTKTFGETVWKVPVRESDPSIGAPDAPLTVVVFSEFQCPFCRKGTALLKRILEEYGDDVRIVFKNYPLPFHKDAYLASEAALAAEAQGKFWEMHDVLFKNQRTLSKQHLEEFAEKLGLDMVLFRKDIVSRRFRETIEAQMEDGRNVGVRGTPNYFVNGRVVKGAVPFDEIRPLLDEELSRGRALVKGGVADPYTKAIENGDIYVPFVEEVMELETADSPTKGNPDAKVEMVLYSEFQCPYCMRFKGPLYKVLELYGDGAKLVFKHFPLGSHQHAHLAAQAATAAGAQGKFWEMHDLLFTNSTSLGREHLSEFARRIGLDVERFDRELDDGTWKAAVDADIALGREVGVKGTPTLFVNGRLYQGTSKTPGIIAKDIDKYILGR